MLLWGIAALVLAGIWFTTALLVAKERREADLAARDLTKDVSGIYEAQVLRSLREIDQALKLVAFAAQGTPPATALRQLDAQELLPPSLIFRVDVLGADGVLLASNHSGSHQQPAALLAEARMSNVSVVGTPTLHEGEWWLRVARRIGPAGDTASVVVISLPAAFFVSSYDPLSLGGAGVLALMGLDGQALVRRSGDDIASGGAMPDFAELLAVEEPVLRQSLRDGVNRYVVVREIYGFPLAVLVGLAEHEQIAAVNALARGYWQRAAAGTLVLLAVFGAVGWLSWRLHLTQQRVMEERVQHAQQVEYLAFHDSLTDLPNRAFFSRLLAQEIKQSKRYERRLALLFLDLDRFKMINDSLGHDAGDELLKEVAQRLRGSVRDSDTVARLGGDEFVVLLPQVEHHDQLRPVAEKILAAVARPFTLAGQEFRVTVSIGATLFPDDGQNEQELMKNADRAMYHAKERGKNNFQYFSRDLRDNSLERMTLESSLRQALEQEQLELYYQVRRSVRDGEITGVEALLRWCHPELGLISPLQFVPVAEQSGLILPIGRWVMTTACRQNMAWQRQGLPSWPIAINLSASQVLHPTLIDDVRAALEISGMPPELLEIEIAESIVMQHIDKMATLLGKLKALGIRVAIDDFGTGYSSVAMLEQFPVDSIKIDRSFIAGLGKSRADSGLTASMIGLGHSLNLTVVAEGVEECDQLSILRNHACDEFQGYLNNEPMPPAELERLLFASRRE